MLNDLWISIFSRSWTYEGIDLYTDPLISALYGVNDAELQPLVGSLPRATLGTEGSVIGDRWGVIVEMR